MDTGYKTNTSFELKAALSLSVAISALFVGMGSAAHAQEETAEDTSRLPTVTVSGTKREQTLQDTPVAISVVQAEEIERAEIQDLNDLQTLVPSLTVRQTQSSSNTSFFIRGFGNGANAIGLEPSVGIFIDGVFRSRAAAYIPDLPNLERVEVLRGPQSTLFGKNASAGVVSVVTQAPQFERQGSIEASVGNYNAFRVKGDITGPLNDRLAYGLSGSINTRDGYVEDLGTGDEYNERNRWGLRGDLLFTPSETVEFRFIADYDKIDEKCCLIGNIVEADEPGAAIVAAGGNVVSEDIFSYEVFYDTPPTNEIENYGFSLQGDYDFGFATLTTISARRHSEEDAVLDADATDLDFLVSNTGTQIGTFTQEVRLTSNPTENSRFDWMVGGFFFDETIEQDNSVLFGEDYRNFLSALLGGPGGIPAGNAQIAGLEAFVGGTPGSTFAQAGQGTFENLAQDNQAWSVFGTADFHVTDRLTATVGLNHTTDEKEVVMDIVSTDALAAVNLDQLGYTATLQGLLAAQGVTLTDPFSIIPFVQGNPAAYAQIQQQALAVAQSDNNPFGGLSAVQIFPPFLSFPNAVEDGTSDDSDTTYTLRLAYDVTDNINVYATHATGFKATSWNLQRQSKPFSSDFTAGNPIVDPVTMQTLFATPSSPITDAGLNTPNLQPGTRFADPEEATVYEIGLKAQFDTIAFNLAIFEQTIENFQTTVFTEDGFVFQNANEQRSRGVEVDTTWSPIRPLTLTFAGTYLDAEYIDYAFGPGVNLAGITPAGIADIQFTTGANFNFLVGDRPGFVRADWQYVGDSALSDNPLDQIVLEEAGYSREQNLVNASAGVMFANDLAVSVWARNLLDDEYLIGQAPAVAQAGSYNGLPNQPRTFGVTVRKSF